MTNHARFPLHPGDWIKSTAHLTTAEQGALLRLLLRLWETWGEPLPDDDRWLARVATVRTQDWRRWMRLPVLSMLHRTPDGRWYSPRIAYELGKLRQRQSKAARAREQKSKSVGWSTITRQSHEKPSDFNARPRRQSVITTKPPKETPNSKNRATETSSREVVALDQLEMHLPPDGKKPAAPSRGRKGLERLDTGFLKYGRWRTGEG